MLNQTDFYLRDLVFCLSKNEIKNLSQYLTCFDPNFASGHKVKTLELLEAILKHGPNGRGSDIIKEIYPDGNHNPYKYLRLRLIEKIHESLLLGVNVGRKNQYSEFATAKIEIRKSLLVVEILWGRGLTARIPRLLDGIIRKAEKFELMNEWLEALELKQQFLGFREGPKAFEELDTEIIRVTDMRRDMRRAKSLYLALALQENFPSVGHTCSETFIKAEADLKKLKDQTGSIHTAFYHGQVAMEMHFSQGNLVAGRHAANAILELLEANSGIFPKRKMGMVLAAHAQYELQHGQSHQALKIVQKALGYFSKSGINYQRVREIEFRCLFQEGAYKQAAKLFHDISPEEAQSFQKQRRLAMHAAALFQLGKWNKANAALAETSHLYQDRAGWNIPLRIFLLMLKFELKEFDSIENQIETLRKNINKSLKEGSIRKRYALIMKILAKWVKLNYDFPKTYSFQQKNLELLQSTVTEYRHDVLSGEIVRFEQWFMDKAGHNHDFGAQKSGTRRFVPRPTG